MYVFTYELKFVTEIFDIPTDRNDLITRRYPANTFYKSIRQRNRTENNAKVVICV